MTETRPLVKFTAAAAAVTGEPIARPSELLAAKVMALVLCVAPVITKVPPPLMIVAPVYVLEFARVIVPVPVLVRARLPVPVPVLFAMTP